MAPDLPARLHHVHAGTDALLLEHQERLVGLELEAARGLLLQFSTALRRHIALEDARLFPLFAARVANPPRGASPQLFLDEHRKIERILEEVTTRLDALIDAGDHPSLRRGVLKLIERELTLAHVLEHHHLREEDLLIPALAEACAPGELESILEALVSAAAPLEPDHPDETENTQR